MFASLFASSPEAALYDDENGRIININPHFTKLFGYTLKEIRGRNIDEGMIYPADKIKEGKILTKKVFNGFSDYETVRKKKDGCCNRGYGLSLLNQQFKLAHRKKISFTSRLYRYR